jgi:hypothetical protein
MLKKYICYEIDEELSSSPQEEVKSVLYNPPTCRGKGEWRWRN